MTEFFILYIVDFITKNVTFVPKPFLFLVSSICLHKESKGAAINAKRMLVRRGSTTKTNCALKRCHFHFFPHFMMSSTLGLLGCTLKALHSEPTSDCWMHGYECEGCGRQGKKALGRFLLPYILLEQIYFLLYHKLQLIRCGIFYLESFFLNSFYLFNM